MVCVMARSTKPAPPNRVLLMAQVLGPEPRNGSRLVAGTRNDRFAPFAFTSHDLICADGKSGIFGVSTGMLSDWLAPSSRPMTSTPFMTSVYRQLSDPDSAGTADFNVIEMPAMTP